MKQSLSCYRLFHFIKVAIITSLFLIAFILVTQSVNRPLIGNNDCHSFISTCGCEADKRGPHQSVIAFSLFGDLSDPSLSARYVQPLKALAANISRVYPGEIVLANSN